MKKIIALFCFFVIHICMAFSNNGYPYPNVSQEETYIILEQQGEGHYYYGSLNKHQFLDAQTILCVRKGDKISVKYLSKDAMVYLLDKHKNIIISLPYTIGCQSDITIPPDAYYIIIVSNNEYYQARL